MSGPEGVAPPTPAGAHLEPKRKGPLIRKVLMGVALFCLLTFALALLIDPVSYYVGFLGSEGTVTYSYNTGTEPIVSAIVRLPPGMASSIVLDEITPGWSMVLKGDTLLIANGSLQPGGSLEVKYHLVKYIEPGSKQSTVTAATSSGNTVVTPGSITVQENVLLKILTLISVYRTPILLASGVGMVSSALPLWKYAWIGALAKCGLPVNCVWCGGAFNCDLYQGHAQPCKPPFPHPCRFVAPCPIKQAKMPGHLIGCARAQCHPGKPHIVPKHSCNNVVVCNKCPPSDITFSLRCTKECGHDGDCDPIPAHKCRDLPRCERCGRILAICKKDCGHDPPHDYEYYPPHKCLKMKICERCGREIYCDKDCGHEEPCNFPHECEQGEGK